MFLPNPGGCFCRIRADVFANLNKISNLAAVMKKIDYLPRLIDRKIESLLETFGAICIEGPKWCGKTWTGMHHSKSSVMLGDPAGNFQNRQLAMLNPALVLDGENPRLIDEWQEVPQLWDAVRYYADQNNEKGLFIMTGSSTPQYKGVMHSGTGRIARVKMRPMSLYESGDSDGKVSLTDLFDNTQKDVITGEISLGRLIELTVRGGWPAALGISSDNAAEISKSYIDSVINNDIGRVTNRKHDRYKIELLLRSLARNESTTATNNKLIQDISDIDSQTINKETLSEYLEVLERLFLVENIKPFSPELRSGIRIKQAKKRHFTDPSLACALLGANRERLSGDLNTYGFMFESLCERDLLTYAEAISGELTHFQDYSNNEIDAIIQSGDGRWGCIEIKLGMNQVDKAAANLLKMNNFFKNNSSSSPAFLAVICGMTSAAYRRPDGVYVVPITSLRP